MDFLQDLASSVLIELSSKYSDLQSELKAEGESISDSIHEMVPTQTRRVRRRLLRLRRDLFNLRSPKPGDVDHLPDEDLKDRIFGFLVGIAALESARAQYREAYERESARVHLLFRRGLMNADFGAGLRLSSKVLASQLNAFLDEPESSLDAKVERGLLRYLTRAAGKATPFGRFCAVMPGCLGTDPMPLRLLGSPSRKWSRVRANKKLIQWVLRHLTADENTRAQLPLRLNPTLAVSPENVTFLAAYGGREAFQTVARNSAVDLVVSTLRRSARGTLRALASGVRDLEEIDATQEEAEAYLGRFFEIGMLQLDLPGIGHDPDWADSLTQLLGGVQDGPVIREVRGFLQELTRKTDQVQRLGIGIDGPAIEALEDFVSSSFGEWFENPPGRLGPLVYEDASAEGSVQIDRSHFRCALDSLEELIGLLAPVAWIRTEPFIMSHFFKERFGDARVPLLEFYEIYYREHVKPLEEERAKRSGNPPPENGNRPTGEESEAEPSVPGALSDPESRRTAEEIREKGEPPPGFMAIKEANTRLTNLIRERWKEDPDSREMVLTRLDLRTATEGVPDLPAEPRSFSTFLVWVPRPLDVEGGLLVLSDARGYAGYGKYFSRFLYLLPEEVLRGLRARHRTRGGPTLAEIAGDAAFNANLRPPIHGTEIIYPSGDRIGCPDSLEVGELEVGFENGGDLLRLFRRGTDQSVLPLDLGFLNPRARPPLYQLLRRFSPASETYLDIPLDPGVDLRRGGRVLHRPRISYEERVVLAREAWAVSVAELPVQEREEDDGEFHLRVSHWRRELNLPERTYVRAVPGRIDGSKIDPKRSAGENEEGKEERNQRFVKPGDLRKPQYLDFSSPFLVRLLPSYSRLGERYSLFFEECLPDLEGLPVGPDGQRWVTESILQADVDPDSLERTEPTRQEELAHA